MAVVEAAPGRAVAAPAGGMLRSLEIVVPAAVLVFIGAVCFLAPFLPVPPPIGGNVLDSYLPAGSPGHLLGTDPNGNDILSRILFGGRASLTVTLSVNAVGLIVGGGLGMLSGFAGGVTDTLIMRVLDMLIAFPSLVLVLAIAQSLGPSEPNTILSLAFFSIPAFARISRSATLRLRELPFITAAELCGTPVRRVLARHVAPNIAPQLVTYAMLGMGIVTVIEGALSFLGLGIPAPAPSWGNMIAQGQASLSATPMLVVWPSAALFVTVLAFNVLGEVLRARWSGR